MKEDYEGTCEDFSSYDHGYRRGVFDKCNGRPHYDFSGVDPDGIWASGYRDGWDGNEVKIMKEVEPDEFSPVSERPERFLALWCEYDFGQQGMLFESEATGRAWLWQAMIAQYTSEEALMKEMEVQTADQFFDKLGLAGFTISTLIRD